MNFYEEKMHKFKIKKKKKKKERDRDEYNLQAKLMYFTIYIQFFLLKKLTQYYCKTWDENDETSKMNQISNAMKYWKH